MRRLLLAVALTLTVAAVMCNLEPDRAAAAYPIKECGRMVVNGIYVDNITTRRTSCRKGRRVARRWVNGGWEESKVLKFRCRHRQIGYESNDVRCTRRNGYVVRFQAGV
jgi:hypothetical protein